MADDAKREAFREWLEQESAPTVPKAFLAAWELRGAHEREKHARLVAAAQAVVGTEGQRAVLQMDMEKIAAGNEGLAAAVAEIGGDDGQTIKCCECGMEIKWGTHCDNCAAEIPAGGDDGTG